MCRVLHLRHSGLCKVSLVKVLDLETLNYAKQKAAEYASKLYENIVRNAS